MAPSLLGTRQAKLPPPLLLSGRALQSCSGDGDPGTTLAWRARARGADHGRAYFLFCLFCLWKRATLQLGEGRVWEERVLPHRSAGPAPPPQCLHCLLATHFPYQVLSHFHNSPNKQGCGLLSDTLPGTLQDFRTTQAYLTDTWTLTKRIPLYDASFKQHIPLTYALS